MSVVTHQLTAPTTHRSDHKLRCPAAVDYSRRGFGCYNTYTYIGIGQRGLRFLKITRSKSRGGEIILLLGGHTCRRCLSYYINFIIGPYYVADFKWPRNHVRTERHPEKIWVWNFKTRFDFLIHGRKYFHGNIFLDFTY